ncbi:hypothetical protein COEX109129_14305 [Corallococcus exiguus]
MTSPPRGSVTGEIPGSEVRARGTPGKQTGTCPRVAFSHPLVSHSGRCGGSGRGAAIEGWSLGTRAAPIARARATLAAIAGRDAAALVHRDSRVQQAPDANGGPTRATAARTALSAGTAIAAPAAESSVSEVGLVGTGVYAEVGAQPWRPTQPAFAATSSLSPGAAIPTTVCGQLGIIADGDVGLEQQYCDGCAATASTCSLLASASSAPAASSTSCGANLRWMNVFRARTSRTTTTTASTGLACRAGATHLLREHLPGHLNRVDHTHATASGSCITWSSSNAGIAIRPSSTNTGGDVVAGIYLLTHDSGSTARRVGCTHFAGSARATRFTSTPVATGIGGTECASGRSAARPPVSRRWTSRIFSGASVMPRAASIPVRAFRTAASLTRLDDRVAESHC